MSPCPLCQLSFFFGVLAGAAIMLIGSIGIRERERRERERKGGKTMPFHKALLNGIKDQIAWSRAKREDVGFGLAGVCPHCGHRNNRLLVGWYNEMAGTGKGQSGMSNLSPEVDLVSQAKGGDGMRLLSLKLSNFQGIKEFHLEPNGEDITVLGANATGKTTLFNSLHLATFRARIRSAPV